jgi:SsrA-binding protein
MKGKQVPNPQVAANKKARFDFFIEEKFEAGLVLEGWEVKSLRAGKLNLTDAYVIQNNQELWLFGAHISPLLSASTHINPDPLRTRKLLLHAKQMDLIFRSLARDGYTCVPLSIYWQKGRAKCEIALAKGKKNHDKRDTERDRDWQREQQRLMKNKNL